jgi:hypothetical protein
MEDSLIDHLDTVVEETKHWLKLENTNNATPVDIVLMKNMEVLLHLLQKILRSQEVIIFMINKRYVILEFVIPVANNANRTPRCDANSEAETDIQTISSKWVKLTNMRTATQAQFVLMANLWLLFQIVQAVLRALGRLNQTLSKG